MTPMEYLLQLDMLQRKIENKQDELQTLYELSTNVTSNCDSERVQSSGSTDKISGLISKIIDLQNEIQSDLYGLIELRHETIKTIEMVQEPELYELLYLRFVKRLTWEHIANIMNYSDSHVRGALYNRALDQIEKIIKQNNTE